MSCNAALDDRLSKILPTRKGITEKAMSDQALIEKRNVFVFTKHKE